MKKEIHPEYKEVVFLDTGTGDKFLCRSALQTDETIDFEGATYPCFKVSITSKSHPFYTGEKGIVDTEGRVDKFKKRYAAKPVQAPVVKDELKKEKEPKKEKEKKKAAPKEEKEAKEKKAPAKKAKKTAE